MDAEGPRPPLKFSLAGVQLKFSAVEAATGGLTIPVSGAGGDWIVKLPSTQYRDVPSHEFLMLELARAVGIRVPDTRLLDAGEVAGLPGDVPLPERQVLAVRRFDRGDGGRVHIEDFAQVFGVYPDEKYAKASSENVGRVLYAESGPESALEFVRRLVFSVLIGNADMHLKNWSLMYPDGRTPELTPAYDLVGTVAYLPHDPNLALSLVGTKRMAAIDLARFARFADRVGLPRIPVADAVRQTVAEFRRAWADGDVPERLPAGQAEALRVHQESLALWRV
jgi:serine/threonine-protein kinase HipA